MTFDELMKDFASILEMKVPVADEKTGACTFSFDGNWVTFRPDVKAKAVVMTAQIGELPAGVAGALFVRVLISANFLQQGTFGCAVLGIDAGTGMCCQRRCDLLASLDGRAYAIIIEGFLDVLEMWQQRLKGISSLARSVVDFRLDRIEELRSSLLGDGLLKV